MPYVNEEKEVKKRKKEYMKSYMKAYSQRPEVRERQKKYWKEYFNRPEIIKHRKEYIKEYYQKPEVKERTKAYSLKPEVIERRKEHYWIPEVRERLNKYKKEYRQKPETKELTTKYNKEYNQRPEVKIYRKKYFKERYQIPEVKERELAYSNKYNLEHHSQIIEKADKLKAEVISRYSNGLNKCAICGISGIEFLTIDHIESRKKYGHVRGIKGGILYRMLKREMFPKGFQVLCWNCNYKKYLDPVLYTKLEDERKQHSRESRQSVKKEVFSALSKGTLQCSCCKKISDINLLTIDHIEGRKAVGHERNFAGLKLYYWLRKNNYPKGFQLLCWNCNVTKGLFGVCPHQK